MKALFFIVILVYCMFAMVASCSTAKYNKPKTSYVRDIEFRRPFC